MERGLQGGTTDVAEEEEGWEQIAYDPAHAAEQPFAESRPDWEIIQLVARKMGGSMNYASSRDILNEIRAAIPLYKDLAPGAVWPKEASPLAGKDADLSLASDTIMKDDVITAERLLFSSGMTITRSKEIGTIRHTKIEV